MEYIGTLQNDDGHSQSEPESSRTSALRVGDTTVELDLAQLEKIEPDSMLLPLLSSRWADPGAQEGAEESGDTPRQLEATGVDVEAVLLLLREYASTGVLRWADVHGFCATPKTKPYQGPLNESRLCVEKLQALLRAALYLGFLRLAPMVPDAPNALTWSELALITQRRSRQSLAGVNLVCQTSTAGAETLHGIDMDGAGLTGMQLSHRIDWSKATLREAGFSLASIDGLRCIDHTQSPEQRLQPTIKFTRADLSSSSFVGAYIRHCSFEQASLKKANFAGAEVAQCHFTSADLQGGSFECATMRACVFSSADLRECTFSGAKFDSCVFSKANLGGCNFGETEFSNCKFGGLTLKDTSFARCTFKPDSTVVNTGNQQNAMQANTDAPVGTAVGLFHDLNPMSDVPSCDFRDGTFRGDFTAGDQKLIVNPKSPSCGLRLTGTEEHRLTQLQFQGGTATSSGAFGGFGGPSMQYNIGSAPRAAQVGPTDANVDDIVYVQSAHPSKVSAVSKLTLAGAKLAGANFDGCMLCNVDFSNSSLRGCSFKGARLCMASLKGADASDADFTGADLSFTNLEGANLSRAHLREASFWCLVGFSDPNVSFGIHKDYSSLRQQKKYEPNQKKIHPLHIPNLPKGAYALLTASRTREILSSSRDDRHVLSGVRAKASCEGANFSGAHLHAADLRGISLRGANLGGASLCYASLLGADVTGAQLDAIGPFDIDHVDLPDDNDDELL